MPVYRIEKEMPARELVEWLAHFRLSAEEAKVEREKAKMKARMRGH